jgi:hypothetical protein
MCYVQLHRWPSTCRDRLQPCARACADPRIRRSRSCSRVQGTRVTWLSSNAFCATPLILQECPYGSGFVIGYIHEDPVTSALRRGRIGWRLQRFLLPSYLVCCYSGDTTELVSDIQNAVQDDDPQRAGVATLCFAGGLVK